MLSKVCFIALSFFIGLINCSDRPIIGIFTQPSTSKEGNCGGSCLYLAASYVKYIESAGGRVVPINYYANQTELDFFISKLNGFMFPGGSSSFPSSAQYVYDQSVKSNLPLWGTCMGFQWLLIAQSKDHNILDPKSGQFDSYNYSIPLDFVPNLTLSKTKIFENAPNEIIKILANENVTMNNHHYGIYTDNFISTKSLNSFFRLISTNYDRGTNNFVSTIESFNYPIYGTQWHPEKNPFEFGNDENINHSYNAIQTSQYMANFFVNQTRLNKNSFAPDYDENKYLIENYIAYKTTGSFMSTYFFHF